LNKIIKFYNYLIYFGDNSSKFFSIKNPSKIFLNEAGYTFFAKQVHTTNFFEVTRYQESFTKEADFLVTKSKKVAIGVLTADCIPIIIVNAKNKICSAVHAGWKGTIKEILIKAVDKLIELGSNKSDLTIFFGPSIGNCCFEVKEDFINQINKYQECLNKHGNKYFFDLIKYNKLLLTNYGIKENQINLTNWECTYCNDQYFSYRRSKGNKERQYSCVKII